MAKVCTKHILNILLVENTFFLENEHVGMGEYSHPKNLLFLLSGGKQINPEKYP